jgi:colanic acid biosynthesis glycosyl transferase WcaI
MRILWLNLYFPPDTSATAKVAEFMVRALAQSHEVTVLCGRPSYEPTERRPWKLWQTERISSNNSAPFTVIRVGSTAYPRMQMKLRLLNYLTYAKLASLRALFIRCDIILAMTDPPFNGISAAIIGMLKRKPVVYDIQDMYPDMAIASSIVSPGLIPRIWEHLHRWALRRAARIIVLGEDMRARIISKGVDPSKIFIVRNSVDVASAGSPSPPLNSEVIRAIRGNFGFVLLHAGNLGFYGAWDSLIAAARQLENDNIGLVFVGDGAERARLESLAAGATPGASPGPTNVRFLPFFPSADIPSVLAAPDAHIVTIKPGLQGVVAPSKMFGILAAGKPIIAVAPEDTDVATLGVRHGFALCANPSDSHALAAAVRQLASDPTRLAAMAAAASLAATQYSRAAEIQKLAFIISAATGAPRH